MASVKHPLIQWWSVWRDKNMQSLHPLKPQETQWFGAKKKHFGAGRPKEKTGQQGLPFLGLTPRFWCASGTDGILPSSVLQNYWVQPNWCSFLLLFIDIYIYKIYIQLQLESNCCRIWEYHNLWKQSFGLCCREIVCEFAGHSFASLRKQGVHVWVPVWRSGPFWYYSFWPVQSETKMRTWSLFIMRYTAIPRVIMSFCVSDNAFSSCIFFVGVRVPFQLEF